MGMDPFSSELKSIDEAPEAFRSELRAQIGGANEVRRMIYTPSFTSAGRKSAASVLALTRTRWLVVEQTPDDGIKTIRSDFARTLLVEVAIVLLHGHLKLDFAVGSELRMVTIDFNAVMHDLYEQAVHEILDGMHGRGPAKRVDWAGQRPSLEKLPLKFQNAVPRFTPAGEIVLAVAHWPAAIERHHLWFERELAPETVCVLSDRELILISDQKAAERAAGAKYGTVATYCLLSRLAAFRIGKSDRLATLSLILRADRATETIEMSLPPGHEAAAEELVRQAVKQSKTKSARS